MDKKKLIRSHRIFIELPDLHGKRFSLKVDGVNSVASLPESEGTTIVHLGKTYGSKLSYAEVINLINKAIRHIIVKTEYIYSLPKPTEIILESHD